MQVHSPNFLLARRRRQLRDAAITDSPAIARRTYGAKRPKVVIGRQWRGGAIQIQPAVFLPAPAERWSSFRKAARFAACAFIPVVATVGGWLSAGGSF